MYILGKHFETNYNKNYFLKYIKSIIIQKYLKGATSILLEISWDQILFKYRHAPN